MGGKALQLKVATKSVKIATNGGVAMRTIRSQYPTRCKSLTGTGSSDT